jgi:hypothetical protein
MAHKHPPFPLHPPSGQYVVHIYAYSALKADAALSRLWSMGHAASHRQGEAGEARAKALWAGARALEAELRECVHKAAQRGELLFCWHGTHATALGTGRAAG